jgi:hypothetical protein
LFLYVMQQDNNFNYIISFHKINKNIIIKINNKKHYIIFYHKKSNIIITKNYYEFKIVFNYLTTKY